MNYEIVDLTDEYLDKMLEDAPQTVLTEQLKRAYFSLGSASRCLLADGVPVFAGGIVNLQWNRGEAWILPTNFFRKHIKVCIRSVRFYLPCLAKTHHFARVQATCVKGIEASIIRHMGFDYEGTLRKFGPSGETCDMYSRIFELKEERT